MVDDKINVKYTNNRNNQDRTKFKDASHEIKFRSFES